MLYALLATVALCNLSLLAQAPAANTLGVVTNVDAAARQIVIKTDAGAEVTVNLQPTASFRRVAPGETNLANASAIALTDISAGDRVLARGRPSEDQKSVAATLIIVMSKSDLANRQATERADWDKRGVTGIVTAAGSEQVTINVRGPGGVKPLIIMPGKDAVVRRYAPDSVKFVDAKPSTIAEIKVGDQVRALGDKSEDGAKLTAQEIVSGSFRTIAATVSSVDTAGNQMRVMNLEGKKPVTVKINGDSLMRKLPPQMAQALAARNRPPEDGAGGRGSGGPGGRGGPGDAGGRAGGRGGDLQQVVDRSPKITLADLKAGDAIIVLSTVGATPDQLTAITLVAGVEPILTAPGRKDMALGEWSLGVDSGGAP
ncbi:MAG: hypothetical protein ABSB35_07555 [Bryobacteraceae bacterium]|jgi:hypothetical protein